MAFLLLGDLVNWSQKVGNKWGVVPKGGIVPNRTVESNGHLTTYQNNNGIIIQFILFELIQAFKHVTLIEESLASIELTPTKKFSKSDRELLDSISEAISSLAGSSQKNMRIFTWNLADGTIAKIKAHCSLFANNLDPQDPDIGSLQRNADRAWIHCLKSFDLVREIQEIPSRETPDLSAIIASLEKMSNRLRRLTKVISNILQQFRSDENVVFFLLNHKERLDEIYEDGFVFKLFHKMFPRGINEAERFLTRKYTTRGFSHLIPLITQKLEEFELATV